MKTVDNFRTDSEKRVLISFPDETLAHVLKIFFEWYGWVAFHVDNTITLTKQMTEVSPVLILIDQDILPLGGIKAIQQIKNQIETANIPVIFFSKSLEIQHLADQAGADCCIEHPFEFKDILKAVNTLCLKTNKNAAA